MTRDACFVGDAKGNAPAQMSEDSEETKPKPGAPGSQIRKYWMSKSGNTRQSSSSQLRFGQKEESGTQTERENLPNHTEIVTNKFRKSRRYNRLIKGVGRVQEITRDTVAGTKIREDSR